MKNSKKTAWIVPTVLVLLICELLTLPLVVYFTYADRADAPEHLLVYKTGSLTWATEENILPSGAAEFKLFSGEYVNVKSDNGDKVVAPGTDGISTVRLINRSDKKVSYIATLYMIEDSKEIPVRPGLESVGNVPTDRYVLPSGVPASAVVKSVEGDLSSGVAVDFDAKWIWEFYENDEQDKIDTLLGNLAAQGKDENVTIGLYIVVEDGSEDIPPTPPTGDPIFVWVAIAGFTMVAFVILLIFFRRKRKNEEE